MAHPWEIMGSSDKENRRGAKSSDSEGGQQGFFFRFCNLELEDALSSFKWCHGSNIGLVRPSQGGYDRRLWTLFFTWLVDKWSKDQKVLGIRHTILKIHPVRKSFSWRSSSKCAKIYMTHPVAPINCAPICAPRSNFPHAQAPPDKRE